jgi:acetyl-CoA/propionyl-CoA carboxylase biotin carboxyl carrier protein
VASGVEKLRALLIEHDGRTYSVYAKTIGTNLWVHFEGETWVLDQRPKSVKKTTAIKFDQKVEEIRSPMPGKILKVNKKLGENVSERQVVVVMEAMKMEYSLSASVNGVVSEISCQVGDIVQLDQSLMRIEKKI